MHIGLSQQREESTLRISHQHTNRYKEHKEPLLTVEVSLPTNALFKKLRKCFALHLS